MNSLPLFIIAVLAAALVTLALVAFRRLGSDGRDSAAERLAVELGTLRAKLEDKEAECNRRLAEQRETVNAALAAKDRELAQRLADDNRRHLEEMARKDATLKEFIAEKENSFGKAVETLKAQFSELAAKTLNDRSRDLSQNGMRLLEDAMKPLRAEMEKLRSATERTEVEHRHLADSIGKDVGRIGDVADALADVSRALASDVRFQGRKGEEILAEKLRQAGLEENVNFFLQSGTAEDRPDAQVCDTENRWLIIDSKVSLTAYFEYAESKDEAFRAKKLAEHVKSVRDKIDQLGRKKYPETFAKEHADRDYLPVTALFMGYEAPLLEALKAEPSLWKRAVDQNVLLVTPLTLLAYLRLVYLAWQHEKEARNRERIVETARELLGRLNRCLIAFEAVGDALRKANDSYAAAGAVLVDARGAHSIANSARRLIDLKVKLESPRGGKVQRAAALARDDDDPPPPADSAAASAVPA